MRRTRFLFGGAVLLLACGPQVQPQNYLTKPFFQFTATDSVCNTVVAVDGNGQGWQQQQCGVKLSGYIPTRVLTAAELASVQAAFAPLPPQTDPSCTNNFLPGSVITYLRRGTTDSDITWTACVAGGELAPPYKAPVDLLQQLVATP